MRDKVARPVAPGVLDMRARGVLAWGMRGTVLPLICMLLGCAGAAGAAEPERGFYVGGGIGFNRAGAPSRVMLEPASPAASDRASNENLNGVAQGSVGYGLGNGVRIEVEGNRRGWR